MQFLVTWEIDIDAENPLDAAQQALAIQRDPQAIATCFTVQDQEGNKTTVDLSEECQADYQAGLAAIWDIHACRPLAQPLPRPEGQSQAWNQGYELGLDNVQKYRLGLMTGDTGVKIDFDITNQTPLTSGYKNGRRKWLRRQLIQHLKGQNLHLVTKEVTWGVDGTEPTIVYKPLRRQSLLRACVNYVFFCNWATLPTSLEEMLKCYEECQESETSQVYILTPEQLAQEQRMPG